MFYLFTSDADLAEAVTESVSDNVDFWSWHQIVDYFNNSLPTVLDFVVKLIIAVIVLLVGRKIIKAVRKWFQRFLERTSWDVGVRQFLDHLLYLGLHFVLILIVLGKFGITASSVIAIIGSVGLSVGLALQGSLSNFAGGVLILLLKPFRVGDYIKEDINGNEGTVQEIQLFYTKLLTLDNITVVLPNGNLANCNVINYTQHEFRRIDLRVGVSYTEDIRRAKAILELAGKEEPKRIPDRPAEVFVDELGDSAVILVLHVWVKSTDYWEVKWRVTEQIKYHFDQNRINIPFPQVEVSFHDEKSKNQYK